MMTRLRSLRGEAGAFGREILGRLVLVVIWLVAETLVRLDAIAARFGGARLDGARRPA